LAVFALGSVLAGLGGALQVAREPANLGMDLTVITDAFVVVVIGGMGSIIGSYVAAVLIAEGASCLRRSVMRCAPAAIRRCAQRQSAFT
jgi:branched-subunit amino acid ABC-type transport system permease component